MRLEKEFEVDRSRESVVEIVASEDTLAGFFPESETEIVSREGNDGIWNRPRSGRHTGKRRSELRRQGSGLRFGSRGGQ